MPNQRDKNKTRVSVWLTKTQRIALERAIEDGVAKDMSDFIIQSIRFEQRRQAREKEEQE